jgi:outer membrane protein
MSMKNLSLIINAILAAAVIVLFILVLDHKSNSSDTEFVAAKNQIYPVKLPIAYVNVDSLLLHYEFAKESNESLIKKQEDSRLRINTLARQLQNEMGDFQNKLENNAFLSRDRAQQEQTRLQKKQQDLQELDGNLSKQLLQVQQKMSEQLRDTINNFIKEYNKKHKYQLIISNTSSDNILYADKTYDITAEVTKLLNERYAKK